MRVHGIRSILRVRRERVVRIAIAVVIVFLLPSSAAAQPAEDAAGANEELDQPFRCCLIGWDEGEDAERHPATL